MTRSERYSILCEYKAELRQLQYELDCLKASPSEANLVKIENIASYANEVETHIKRLSVVPA